VRYHRLLALGFVAALVGGCAAQPSATIPPGQPPTVWTSAGHGIAGDFNNQDDTAITPQNVRYLQNRWTVLVDSPVTSEPVVSGDLLYFGTWNGSVYAVNRYTGQVVWKASVAEPTTQAQWYYGVHHAMVHGALLLYRGTLYVVATDGRVYAFNPETGALLWRSPETLYPADQPDWVEAGPLAYHGVLYISIGGRLGDYVGEEGAVAAVSAEDGHLLWETHLVRFQGYDAGVFGPPALLPSQGLLYVATANPVFAGTIPPGPWLYTDSIVALSMKTGRVVWYYGPTHRHNNDLDFLAGPTIWYGPGGRPMVGAGEKSGVFYAVDARTGRLVWETDLTQLGLQTFITNNAAAGYGRLFIGTFDIPLAVLYGGIFPQNYQPPATGRLVALDAATGKVDWSFPMASAVPITPVVGDGLVFADSSNGQLYALDVRTGRPLWWNSAHGEVRNAEAALTLVGDQLFVPVAEPPTTPGGPYTGGVTMFSLAPTGQG
jgi:polyvinyl alcohol dehydrogenase (cytochrome)